MIDQNCVMVNWNVRGLNNPARRKVVRDLVTDQGCTIVCLQETKKQLIDDATICEAWGRNSEHTMFIYLRWEQEVELSLLLMMTITKFFRVKSEITRLQQSYRPQQEWGTGRLLWQQRPN